MAKGGVNWGQPLFVFWPSDVLRYGLIGGCCMHFLGLKRLFGHSEGPLGAGPPLRMGNAHAHRRAALTRFVDEGLQHLQDQVMMAAKVVAAKAVQIATDSLHLLTMTRMTLKLLMWFQYLRSLKEDKKDLSLFPQTKTSHREKIHLVPSKM